MAYINDDWLQYEYETMVLVKYIENNLNQINRDYFEGNLGILSVTNNSDYVTVKNRGVYIADYDTQKLSDALKDFSEEDIGFLFPYGLWDYLEHCKYTPESQKLFVELENLLDKIDTYFSHRSKLSIEQQNDKVNICKNDECLSFFIEPLVTSLNNVDIDHSFDDLWDYLEYEFQYHGVKSDNELKSDEELTFSEKRQVALVDWLLSEPAPAPTPVHKTSSLDDWTLSLIPQSPDFRLNTEASTLNELVEELERKNEQLFEQLTVLNETITQLSIRVYKLEEENKQLKSNQSEVKTKSEPKPKPEPKPTAKKRPKFKLPENFADYQQECDDLVNALSCFYNIKKGKWNGNILQFILTPTDAQKEKQLYPYPNNWRAGLYLQPGQWSIDKVNLADPDEWEEWFMDVYDFADSNDIEIS